MKLARILFEGQPRIAVVRDETFVLLPAHIDGLEFLAMSSTEQATVVSDGFHLSDVASQTLLSPIDPRSMRDFMTFEQHLAGAMLRNPRWALNAAEKLGVKIAWPLSLERGRTVS